MTPKFYKYMPKWHWFLRFYASLALEDRVEQNLMRVRKHKTMNYTPIHAAIRSTAAAQTAARPMMNIQKTGEHLLLQFAVPGYRKEDLSIQVVEQELIVEGKASRREATGFVRREFAPANFRQSYRLGARIDREAIHAVVEDGVLTVTLGLVQPRRHEVAIA